MFASFPVLGRGGNETVSESEAVKPSAGRDSESVGTRSSNAPHPMISLPPQHRYGGPRSWLPTFSPDPSWRIHEQLTSDNWKSGCGLPTLGIVWAQRESHLRVRLGDDSLQACRRPSSFLGVSQRGVHRMLRRKGRTWLLLRSYVRERFSSGVRYEPNGEIVDCGGSRMYVSDLVFNFPFNRAVWAGRAPPSPSFPHNSPALHFLYAFFFLSLSLLTFAPGFHPET